MTDAVSKFGDRLRDSSKDAGFPTVAALARRLNIVEQTLSNYWKGKRFAPADLLFEIADVLSVNPRWLVTGFGERQLPPELTSNYEDDVAALIHDFRSMESWQRAALLSMAGTIRGRNVIDIEDVRRGAFKNEPN
ncbi:helix-turn-helix transcriptional regulator [Sphingomonas sp. SCN 67-18]|uniref:helix-turn-helix domain-containing protein n=1 Tax=uncultured Sphingomonas sp. TaxID=158754 RepID=UPI002607EA71|nr:helix-turn-helix transcriptional regulator [uncultured Sphingomonas sp.]